ncbi:MAG: LON peptidase substrate-binding domain-containing protein, partial [Lentisphaeria bacterium]|nr:LON peptidase substrate-binding domain-containing protein [Lentisphaeria bacterium]
MIDNDNDTGIPPASSLTFSVEGTGVVADEPAVMLIMNEPVLFPHGLTSLTIVRPEEVFALSRAIEGDRLVAIFNCLPDENELATVPFKESFYRPFKFYGVPVCSNGVMARVVKELRMPDNTLRIVVRGLRRITAVTPRFDADGIPTVSYRNVLEPSGAVMTKATMAYQKNIIMTFQEISSLQPGFPEELTSAVNAGKVPSRTCDIIADAMNFSYPEKLALQTFPDIINRMEYLSVLLNRELETL